MKRITPDDIEEMLSRGYDRSTIAKATAWLDVCKRADKLILKLDIAFDRITLGDGIGLWESNGIDNYCVPEELKRLRATDEKLDWRRISSDALNHCNAAPAFLDAKGLYFHAPAFITAELRGDLQQGFIGQLIYNSFSAPDFSLLLTDEQRYAIIACISFYGSIEHYSYAHEDIAAAILRFSTKNYDKQCVSSKTCK